MYTFKAIKFETKLRYHIFTSILDEKEMNDDIKKIITIELDKLSNRISEKNYMISFNESVLNEIINLNTMEEYGARPIKRIIQNLCEDFISDEILKGNIVENKSIELNFENEKMNFFVK